MKFRTSEFILSKEKHFLKMKLGLYILSTLALKIQSVDSFLILKERPEVSCCSKCCPHISHINTLFFPEKEQVCFLFKSRSLYTINTCIMLKFSWQIILNMMYSMLYRKILVKVNEGFANIWIWFLGSTLKKNLSFQLITLHILKIYTESPINCSFSIVNWKNIFSS